MRVNEVGAISPAPAVILGAAAARTKYIRLTSAVTVLSTADPVRVFQEFATLDLISHGRAEIVAGRGSVVESYPLFGFQLEGIAAWRLDRATHYVVRHQGACSEADAEN
jgi:alkanesulfonate monooxygenase SsuD/methylene tetrahydromethanopterin reductase-like flavin-dependent oxidoreductase (luciferase family)